LRNGYSRDLKASSLIELPKSSIGSGRDQSKQTGMNRATAREDTRYANDPNKSGSCLIWNSLIRNVVPQLRSGFSLMA
jgi:hypothetical protein